MLGEQKEKEFYVYQIVWHRRVDGKTVERIDGDIVHTIECARELVDRIIARYGTGHTTLKQRRANGADDEYTRFLVLKVDLFDTAKTGDFIGSIKLNVGGLIDVVPKRVGVSVRTDPIVYGASVYEIDDKAKNEDATDKNKDVKLNAGE